MSKFMVNKRNVRLLLIYTALLAVIAVLCIYIHNIKCNYETKISTMKVSYENKLKAVNQTANLYKSLYSDNETTTLVKTRQLEDTKKEYEGFKNTVAQAQKQEASLSRGTDYNIKNFSPITESELNAWIKNHFPTDSPFIGKASAFIKAANKSGLDPKFICALAGVESNYGRSNIARSKNNFFGIMAYNASPYSSSKSFSNLENGIVEGSKWIATNFSSTNYMSISSMQSGNKIYSQNNDGSANQCWTNQLVNIMNLK